MKALIFFRHGKIAPEWHEKFYGRLDVSLSDEGMVDSIRAAEELAKLEGVTKVYTSPLERAKFPARLLAEKARVELIVDPLLLEIDYGAWAGRPRNEVLAEPLYWERFKDDSLSPPHGESIRDLRRRARAFWQMVKNSEEKGIIPVFTHGGFLRALFCEVWDLPSKHFFCVEILHLRGLVFILFDDDNFLVRGLNIAPQEVLALLNHSYW